MWTSPTSAGQGWHRSAEFGERSMMFEVLLPWSASDAWRSTRYTTYWSTWSQRRRRSPRWPRITDLRTSADSQPSTASASVRTRAERFGPRPDPTRDDGVVSVRRRRRSASTRRSRVAGVVLLTVGPIIACVGADDPEVQPTAARPRRVALRAEAVVPSCAFPEQSGFAGSSNRVAA
jgi:hypothetical protein